MRSYAAYVVAVAAVVGSGAAAQPSGPALNQINNWPAAVYWQPSPEQSERRADTHAGRSAKAVVSGENAAAASVAVFVAVTPCRLVDTRQGTGFTGVWGPPSLASYVQRNFDIPASTRCPIPSSAVAYSLNVTALPPGPLAFLSVWQEGAAYPYVSTLNSPNGTYVANAAIVPAGTNGGITVLASDPTDLLVDINGYYALQSSLPNILTGTAVAPALRFGDNTTGLFSSGPGMLSIATTGMERVTVGPTGNVGIGTTPDSKLSVGGVISTSGGIRFPDSTVQSTATVQGPAGPKGDTGATGPEGPIGPPGPAGSGLAMPLAGTVTEPAITFRDVGTGLFSDTAGTVSVASGGTKLLTVSSDGTLDITADINKKGVPVLQANSTSHNMAVGLSGLRTQGTGGTNINNIAVGDLALSNNSAGGANVAVGVAALASNVGGSDNTAVGSSAMWFNTTGAKNTAVGKDALRASIQGNENAAVGVEALKGNGAGSRNTALGFQAGLGNSSGNDNTAIGHMALAAGTTGSYNVALGAEAGVSAIVGSYNVFIANAGQPSDTNRIRIGDANHAQTFIAGIRGTTTGAADAIPVYIDSNGQLGTVSSSRRVKYDVRDMRDSTGTIMALRPVEFHYKLHDSESPVQFGLIAEEVAEIAPELVVRNKAGEIETVYYEKVNAMLLHEVQKLHRERETQARLIERLESRLAELESRVK